MINKRLIALIEVKKYIGLTVLYQWIALPANIVFMLFLARMIQALFLDYLSSRNSWCLLHSALLYCD